MLMKNLELLTIDEINFISGGVEERDPSSSSSSTQPQVLVEQSVNSAHAPAEDIMFSLVRNYCIHSCNLAKITDTNLKLESLAKKFGVRDMTCDCG